MWDKKQRTCRKCKSKWLVNVIDDIFYFICPPCENKDEENRAERESSKASEVA